ncbi:MAG: phosphodiester glycosidase family protein [Syntrophomonadaceae bacterium]|jgi:exopolysaccharide biosynthesis protein
MKLRIYLIIIIPIFFLGPFIGSSLALMGMDNHTYQMSLPAQEVSQCIEELEKGISSLHQNAAMVCESAAELEREYQEQEQTLEELAIISQSHKELSDKLYEERIIAMLGPAIDSYTSDKVNIKLFKLDELGYRGYIAKVKLLDPSAVKVVLGQDELGGLETTSSAVSRTGAILGVNGGGFFNSGEKILPIGNTVVDGEFVSGFHPSNGDVFFTGISKNGKLIGGKFYEKESLTQLNPQQGVSFLPILIKAGKPQPVPEEWQSTKQPRTIIGEYANGDFIMIVVDGRQSDWSSGVTLERLQNKLAELGVKEGYNLDGGGSSTMVFKGQVLNRPSDGKERKVSNNIVIMP